MTSVHGPTLSGLYMKQVPPISSSTRRIKLIMKERTERKEIHDIDH